MRDAADNLVLRHLRELRGHMDERFDRVDARLDLHEERFVKVDAQFADLRGLVFDTRKDVAAIAGRMEKVDISVAGISRRLGNVEIDVGATRADVQTVVRRLDSLETTLHVSERLTNLEHQVAELRRQPR